MSAGHLQMMTAPIKPLGMYFFKTISGELPSREVGGRLYLDLTHDLSTPLGRKLSLSILNLIGDKLLSSAIESLINRKEFIKTLPRGKDKVFFSCV